MTNQRTIYKNISRVLLAVLTVVLLLMADVPAQASRPNSAKGAAFSSRWDLNGAMGTIYVSSSSGGAVGADGVIFADEDILKYEPASGIWSKFLDGSDVGLGVSSYRDIDALHILEDSGVLFSVSGDTTLPGIGAVDDSDIIRFTPASLGSGAARVFSLYFDGSDVGLASFGEDIDAVTILADGDLLVSTLGSGAAGGLSFEDEDILRFTPESLGENTTGSWSLFFDGSDVGLGNSPSEDVWGIALQNKSGNIVLTTEGKFFVLGAEGDNSDFIECELSSLGDDTKCIFKLVWDGSANGIGGEQIDAMALHIQDSDDSPQPGKDLHISQVMDNQADYPESRIPSFEKMEITFQVDNSVAENYQLPYDSNPPQGIDPDSNARHRGISVDAYFLPPGESDWDQAYAQPGFFYRNYDYDVREGHDWFYPTSSAWKIRFSPNIPGEWQYKISARDESGYVETVPASFRVASSNNKGFVKVSERDRRYFEHDDGSVFYQMGFNRGVDFADPVSNNAQAYDAFGKNDVKFIRTWISPIYGAAWPEFLGSPVHIDGYLPRPNILPFHNPADDTESLTVHIDYELEGNSGWFSNCAWQRWDDPEAVKQDSDYRIRVKYRAVDVAGPRDRDNPDYGVVIKTGGAWSNACHDPDEGVALSEYGHNNDDWDYLETIWNSGSENWLTKLFIVLENVNEGNVYLDSISVQEVLGNGRFGPNILAEGDFQYDVTYPESELWSIDQLLEQAEANDVYIKMVIGDKSDKMWWKIDDDGTYVIDGEPDNTSGYYGNWYNLDTNGTNRTRWLQRAWWRYLQARYGYSPHVHSWEFTNEGDPSSGKHWSATDLLGRYMKCEVFGIPTTDSNGDGLPVEGDQCDYDHPNAHMVSTSFWHSFPTAEFWGNSDWPNVDYADVHIYTHNGWQENPDHVLDTALFHIDYSADVRQKLDSASGKDNVPTKPIVRGEVGLSRQSAADDLPQDTNGVWLHNFTWATLDPGAMYELFWELRDEIRAPVGPDGQPGLYEVYKYFGDFISDIPLNNGHYQDAAAVLTDGDLRVTGQKDVVNDRAHLWIQNRNHTWRKVVGENAETGLTGSVSIAGFSPNTSLSLEWHEFTTEGNPNIVKGFAKTGADGTLTLELPADPSVADAAVKIGDYAPPQFSGLLPIVRSD